MIDAKPKTPRSPEYMDFIREQPCLVCGATPCDPAHTGRGGKGIKASDYSCVPLCRRHHNQQHQIGAKSFADMHSIDYTRSQVQHMERYIEQLERRMAA